MSRRSIHDPNILHNFKRIIDGCTMLTGCRVRSCEDSDHRCRSSGVGMHALPFRCVVPNSDAADRDEGDRPIDTTAVSKQVQYEYVV